MKKLALASSVLLLLALALPALGGDDQSVTLTGQIQCAKCGLHEEGRTKCQNVLVVNKDEATSYYYLVKNEVNEEFGEVCTSSVPVEVTGTLSEKDGKTWLAAEKITRKGTDLS